jgi:hypothetical protein
MEKPNYTGGTADKVMRNLFAIASVLYSPDLDKDRSSTKDPTKDSRESNAAILSLWKKFGDTQLKMWAMIEQHEDFDERQILELHHLSNKFMCLWIDLFGDNNMSNYVHTIGSEHLTFFVSKYRNLYRFSQQGWESFNRLLKHYYFNNTNHGGSKGNGGKDSSGQFTNGTVSGDHCRPLVHLCQRTILWK